MFFLKRFFVASAMLASIASTTHAMKQYEAPTQKQVGFFVKLFLNHPNSLVLCDSAEGRKPIKLNRANEVNAGLAAEGNVVYCVTQGSQWMRGNEDAAEVGQPVSADQETKIQQFLDTLVTASKDKTYNHTIDIVCDLLAQGIITKSDPNFNKIKEKAIDLAKTNEKETKDDGYIKAYALYIISWMLMHGGIEKSDEACLGQIKEIAQEVTVDTSSYMTNWKLRLIYALLTSNSIKKTDLGFIQKTKNIITAILAGINEGRIKTDVKPNIIRAMIDFIRLGFVEVNESAFIAPIEEIAVDLAKNALADNNARANALFLLMYLLEGGLINKESAFYHPGELEEIAIAILNNESTAKMGILEENAMGLLNRVLERGFIALDSKLFKEIKTICFDLSRGTDGGIREEALRGIAALLKHKLIGKDEFEVLAEAKKLALESIRMEANALSFSEHSESSLDLVKSKALDILCTLLKEGFIEKSNAEDMQRVVNDLSTNEHVSDNVKTQAEILGRLLK